MKTAIDERLTNEATSFGFRFACEDCVHFAVERERTCGNGWPVRLHRSALDREGIEPSPPLAFCKEFELA
jgi:hypothetical protein